MHFDRETCGNIQRNIVDPEEQKSGLARGGGRGGERGEAMEVNEPPIPPIHPHPPPLSFPYPSPPLPQPSDVLICSINQSISIRVARVVICAYLKGTEYYLRGSASF